MPSVTDLYKLLRPKQWSKNLVCFAGVFFSGRMGSQYAFRAVLATVCFCGISSFVYIINDIVDRGRDRNHRQKKFRPIASGKVTVPQALILAAAMAAIAMTLGLCVGRGVPLILTGYAMLNICYSLGLKNLSLVEVTVVAMGFILRIYAGTLAADVLPSAWILLCAFFLSLFLAFGKRRAEINAAMGQLTASRQDILKYTVTPEGDIATWRTVREDYENVGHQVAATREVLHKYNVAMLDRFCNICATLTIATYALFTVQAHSNHALIITTPPVVMGIFRYLLLVERYHEGEAPDAILAKDWAIQLAILIWAVLYIAVLYLGLRIDVQ